MFARVGGLRVSYEVAGDGRPLVLLHGWGGDLRSFHPIQQRLAERNRIYALDFPGFGRSASPPTAWGVNDFADNLSGWLDEIGVERASFIGHSFGGRVAIVLATQQPRRVDHLVLVDSAGIRPRRTLGYHVRVQAAKVGRRLVSIPALEPHRAGLERRLFQALGSSDYLKAGPLRPTFVRVVNEDLRPLLATIQAPTLLVWGDHDDATPVADARIMAREIPDSRLVVFAGAGHFSYLDRPDEFCQLVEEFIG